MSKAKNQPAKPNSSLQSTRQLLDELDVMMKSMLELPAGEAAEIDDHTTSTLTEPLSKDFEEPDELLGEESFPDLPPTPEFPGYQHEPEPEPKQEQQPPKRESSASAKVMAQTLVDQGKEPASESGDSQPNNPTVAKPKTLRDRPALNSPLIQPRRRWWYWPLNTINLAFDAVTYLFGPLGKWLRKPGGRTAVGWLGVVFLLTAVVWQVLMWTIWK